jgi:hypothetical protein
MRLKSVLKNRWVFSFFLLLVAGVFLLALHYFRRSPKLEPLHSLNQSPLYEVGDRPMTIFAKGVAVQSGKMVNFASTIYQSKTRVNQMKQAILAYLNGPRDGNVQVPVPEGTALNEFYFTSEGAAVVDLSLAQVNREKVGFYEEALFVRGLIDTLTGNFFEIKQVKILVDGQDQPTLFGHYALGTSEASMPVTANSNLKY